MTVFNRRVSPFGHRRFKACTRLPDAFRSVPRPSSALDAKASPVRLLSLVSFCGDRDLALVLSLSVCLMLLRYRSYSILNVPVGLDRLELSTSPLSEERSNQLSYRPMLVELSVVQPRWQP